jgi:hypothetical protein
VHISQLRVVFGILETYNYLKGILYPNIRHAVAQWLRYCATSPEVADSRPDEVNEFFSIYLIFPAVLGPGVYSASNRNEYQEQKNNV